MFKIEDNSYSRLVLPPSASATPTDNDGVLTDSEPHIQACIIKAATDFCGVENFNAAQLASIRETFGQGDHEMSVDLYQRLVREPELSKSERLEDLDAETFVPAFVDARKELWGEWAKEGIVQAKPFALEYLNDLRASQRLLGLVTGMPFEIVRETVAHVLKADDILPATRDRRVCCDDFRLEGRGKPDPRGYELGLTHFVDSFDIDPRDMWVIEDRANGAVAALSARYQGEDRKYNGCSIGKVIVIPDEHDLNPVELWDKKNLMENHLAQYPEDRQRIFFLRSLESLSLA